MELDLSLPGGRDDISEFFVFLRIFLLGHQIFLWLHRYNLHRKERIGNDCPAMEKEAFYIL